MAVEIVRHRFTVEDYHRMAHAGVLGENDRVELIEGEIVEMAPVGSRHASCVDRLVRLFTQGLGEQVIVRVQNPVRLGERPEPQPDLALLRPRLDFYAEAHPGPKDVFLLVEVADTSASYERQVKLPFYAQWGIPEVWLVDLAEGVVEVCREPRPEGYAMSEKHLRGQRLAPRAFPTSPLPLTKCWRKLPI